MLIRNVIMFVACHNVYFLSSYIIHIALFNRLFITNSLKNLAGATHMWVCIGIVSAQVCTNNQNWPTLICSISISENLSVKISLQSFGLCYLNSPFLKLFSRCVFMKSSIAAYIKIISFLFLLVFITLNDHLRFFFSTYIYRC